MAIRGERFNGGVGAETRVAHFGDKPGPRADRIKTLIKAGEEQIAAAALLHAENPLEKIRGGRIHGPNRLQIKDHKIGRRLAPELVQRLLA